MVWHHISACVDWSLWVGPDFCRFGSGSDFILRAQTFVGLKKSLNKLGFSRTQVQAILNK
jgi:hypothetical protein